MQVEYIANDIQEMGTLNMQISASRSGYAYLLTNRAGEIACYRHQDTYPFTISSIIAPSQIASKVLRLHTPFTLIPAAEYDASLRDKIAREAFTFETFEELGTFEVQGLVGIYIVSRDILSHFTIEFKDIEVEHVAKSLIQLQHQQDPSLLAHWVDDGLILVGIHNGIKLVNKYKIEVPEDAVYYILAGYQHTGLDPLDHPLSMSGLLTRNSIIYEKLEGFIRHIIWVNDNTSFERHESFPPHLFFHLGPGIR